MKKILINFLPVVALTLFILGAPATHGDTGDQGDKCLEMMTCNVADYCVGQTAPWVVESYQGTCDGINPVQYSYPMYLSCAGTKTPTYTQASCATYGLNCGIYDGGCGTTVDCGTCTGSDTCVDGVCTPADCVDSTWTPATNTVCSGLPFTQTSNCEKTRPATGTKIIGCCTPNDCAANTCIGLTCDNGCRTVWGTKPCCTPDCSNAPNVCSGTSFGDGCPGLGRCWGTKNCPPSCTPSCPATCADTCSGVSCGTDGCTGNCYGTKNCSSSCISTGCPATCSNTCAGVSCGVDNCNNACFGTKACCTPSDPGCASNTCIGLTCWDGCNNIPGTMPSACPSVTCNPGDCGLKAVTGICGASCPSEDCGPCNSGKWIEVAP